jgi:diadenylate cyclase
MMDNALAVIQNLRIQDIFDIAIISIMISAVLIWFKGRASRFVFIGISLLGLIYVTARFFQLYLTTVVLQGFFAILIFVLVVIFQEDLRRFFERLAILGRVRRKIQATLPHSQTAEIIAQSVANFSRKRIGALIIIQGNDPLDRHLSGGTELNGSLSQPLLESIFDPHSIGHDGAVIIDGNTVSRFGCHLPLSQNTSKYGSLGLRHTAALGLSERSDAICIVVSEEKGTISVAKEEKIEEVANASALAAALESFYTSKAPVKKFAPLALWLKENTKEKIIALILACILWLVFGYQRESIRRDFTIPIEYLNVPPEWVIEEPKITEAKVTLTGPSQAFQLLNTDTLKISLNLSQLQEGKQELALGRDMIRTPFNLSVVGIKPGRITIAASKFIRVSVPIDVITENTPDPSVTVQKISAVPSSVKVLVPGRLYRSRIKIQTEPINLKSLTSTKTFAPMLHYPSDIQFEGGKPPSVKVVVKIRKKLSLFHD